VCVSPLSLSLSAVAVSSGMVAVVRRGGGGGCPRRVGWPPLRWAAAACLLLLLLIVAGGTPAKAEQEGVAAGRQHASRHGALQKHLQSSMLAVRSGSKRSGSRLGTYYHTTKEIYDEVHKLAKSCSIIKIGWERTEADGKQKSLMTIRVNYEPEKFPNKKERALLFFGEHARELISPETGLEFLRRICNPSLRETKLKNVDAPIRSILEKTEFLIFPNANPTGRRITEKGDYCNRVNDNGVDLNRNWGEHWSAENNYADTYPGDRAWSEAETVILATAAIRYKPTIFISVHSGSLHMLSPFAYKASTGGEPASSRTAEDPPNTDFSPVPKDALAGTGLKPVLRVLDHVNQDFCRCVVGAAGKELGYLSPGTCLDYIYNRVGTRYAFALEIYGGQRIGFAGKRRRGSKKKLKARKKPSASSLLQQAMSPVTSLLEVDSSEFLAPELQPAALAASLVETRSHLQNLAQYPSFELPTFFELGAGMEAWVEADLKTDADIAEHEGTVFPQTRTTRNRRCLYNFNPVSRRDYDRTIDHWTRGLLAIVNSIEVSRPAESKEEPHEHDRALLQHTAEQLTQQFIHDAMEHHIDWQAEAEHEIQANDRAEMEEKAEAEQEAEGDAENEAEFEESIDAEADQDADSEDWGDDRYY
jgi:hypothetical protein